MATRRHLDSSTILRPGEVDDLDAVMDIMGSAFSARFGEAWTRSQCAGILPMHGVSLTIAEGRNGPSGFSLVRTVADEAELLLLAVDPAEQRQGIGQALLRATHEAAGLHTNLILLAAPAAQTYYAHIGLRQHPSAWVLDAR